MQGRGAGGVGSAHPEVRGCWMAQRLDEATFGLEDGGQGTVQREARAPQEVVCGTMV